LEKEPGLHINLLGGFRLTFHGSLIPGLESQSLQRLLAYLLLHRASPLSRQQIAFLFWPETSESQSRTNLRHLLHRLRAAWPEASQYILADGQFLAWNPDAPFMLDVAEFEHASAAESWQQAVDLYGGDLLPDFYQDWVIAERERLGQDYIKVLEHYVEWLNSEGHYAEAIQACQRLLRRDSLREETYRQLMRLYATRGESTKMLRTYEACVDVLGRDLGIEPSAETQAEFQRYLQAESISAPRPNRIRGNIPAALDKLVGRSAEKEQVERLVSSHRLVTLTGFGGVGKTRLAMDIARQLRDEFPAGVWLLDLTSVLDPALIPQAATAIFNIREQADCQLVECLIDFLYHKRALLVVDNCEHLLNAAAQFILNLLEGCPELHILATSRVSLRLAGEMVYPVPPLSVPAIVISSDLSAPTQNGDSSDSLSAVLSESEQLFLERARAILPDFHATAHNQTAIAQVCRRLNGIPLAVELAAGRVNSLAVEQIVRLLDDALKLLRRSNTVGLPRHQTLQATLDWSHALLSPAEQVLFRRLSVFAGSFSLESAEAIACEDIEPDHVLELLSSLIDHSFVMVEETDNEAWYRLHEVSRQYAREKLAQAGEQKQVLLNCLVYYCRLVENAEPMLRSSEQLTWLRRLDREIDNLRATLRWGTREKQGDKGEKMLRLVGALWLYWFIRGRFVEGLYWTEKALAIGQADDVQPAVRGKALYTAASFMFFMGHLQEAAEYSQVSLATCRAAQDLFGEVVSLHHLGLLAVQASDIEQASDLLHTGLDKARQGGEGWLISILLIDLGHLALQQEEWMPAYQLFQESLAAARQMEDPSLIYYALFNSADVAIRLGNRAQAMVYNRQAMALCRENGDVRSEAICLSNDADLSILEGQHDRARRLRQECLALFWDTRDRENTLFTLERLAHSTWKLGEAEKTIQILSACLAARQQYGLAPSTYDQAEVNTLIDSLRAEVDNPSFEAAWTAGQLIDLEDAVELALQS
jgi:predicted ATPase/DNA-binding SARP family transcriptional activator